MTREYKINKLGKDVTMTVTFSLAHEWRIRKFIAVWLIKLACIVLDCNIVMEAGNETNG